MLNPLRLKEEGKIILKSMKFEDLNIMNFLKEDQIISIDMESLNSDYINIIRAQLENKKKH